MSSLGSKPNSKKPTTPTAFEVSPLATADVCRIIEACGRAGVAVFRMGDLYLRLGPSAQDAPVTENVTAPLAPLPATTVAETQTKISEKALLEAELIVKEQQLAEMEITDPFQAEQLYLDGALTEETTKDGAELAEQET